LGNSKNIYFLSDFHLGAPNKEASLIREKRIVAFLDSIEHNATEIFVVGDMFDFWFEYKQVVPKGYVRILGKLAQLTDAGIAVHFFVGNHDMWMRNYFETELNIPVYYEPQTIIRNNLKILVGHGDGLGPGDKGYKRLKKVFRNQLSQFLFGILPPQLGIGLANYFSKKSRLATGTADSVYLGDDKEWLLQYCKHKLTQEHYDYFIFGHRHLPIHKPINNSTYINLGEWINYESYAVLTGTTIALQYNK
jgi:UDP-2,3-diacylglucosamine hydrolase